MKLALGDRVRISDCLRDRLMGSLSPIIEEVFKVRFMGRLTGRLMPILGESLWASHRTMKRPQTFSFSVVT